MEDLIEITGFFMGDGFWLDDRVAFSNTNEELINRYFDMIIKIGFKAKLYKRKKSGNRKDEYTLVAERKFSKIIREIIENIVSEIENVEKSKAFLRGIFDAEGSISFRSTRRGREIKITNTDEEIISLVRRCLKNLKIKNNVSSVKDFRPNRRKYFNVRMYGESSINFLQIIRPSKILIKSYIEGKIHPKYLDLFQ